MAVEQNAAARALNDEEQILSQAESLASSRRWGNAVSLLQEYQQIHTLSVEALGKLAFYCSQDGDYDGAILLYKGLIQQQPTEAQWFYCLGFQYQQKKQWPDAIAAYEENLRLAPRFLKAALRLGDWTAPLD